MKAKKMAGRNSVNLEKVPAKVTLDVTSREVAKGLTAKEITKSVKSDLKLLRKFSLSS
ncbi:MAG: hypothetical protein ABW101_12855 [Candidatus Thiodiazotropha sp.]